MHCGRIKIGVMGSAGGEMVEEVVERCRELGRAIADEGCAIVTGACPGLPHFTLEACKKRGGLTVGVSPAISYHEHIERYGSPVDFIDVMVYTGAGVMGREVTCVRSSDIVIFAGGRSGTLGEFAIAYDEGRPIGVLTKTGGVADHVSELLTVIHKPTGATVVYNEDPRALIKQMVREFRENPPVIRDREAQY